MQWKSLTHSEGIPAYSVESKHAREQLTPSNAPPSRLPRRRDKASSIPWSCESMFPLKRVIAVRYAGGPARHPHKVTAFVAVLPHSCGDRTTGRSSPIASERVAAHWRRAGVVALRKHPVRLGVAHTYIARTICICSASIQFSDVIYTKSLAI